MAEVEEVFPDQCQLLADIKNRVLVLEFPAPTEMFAFDIPTAEGLRDALTRGITMLRQLDS